MKYVGGKDKYAYDIAKTITKLAPAVGTIYEPFCGGLSVSKALAHNGWHVKASDINESLIVLYKAVLGGWNPPSKVSKEEFYSIISGSHLDPLYGFVNLACTFNGKWLGKYQEPKSDGIDYVDLYRAILVAMRSWWTDKIELQAKHYLEVTKYAKEGDIFYFDPPYENSSNSYCVRKFDFQMFRQEVIRLIKLGCHIFISEYSFPLGRVVWSDKKYSKWSFREERLYYANNKHC